MKTGVIGGGIFGVTAAVKLAEAGHEVHLFEALPRVLEAASGINQYRLHRGYHYPRSKPTAISSVTAEPLFKKEYAEAIVTSPEHYYAIAREGSKVTGEQFLKFCDSCSLAYKKVSLPLLNNEKVEVVIQAEEDLVNPLKLREIVKKNLVKSGVTVHLNTKADASIINEFDVVVNATYANLNYILPDYKRKYQFELCEKPVLKLPEDFRGKSIVVMDGPFMCVDPYDKTEYHVMGNVVHAIHATNVGFFPEIPKELLPLMNRGVVKNPPITNIKKFIKSADEFMPEIAKAEHIGSMYTVRTVLPDVDHTDERPTLVYRVNEKVINIFSGKLGNSVQAAIETLEEVERIRNERGLSQ